MALPNRDEFRSKANLALEKMRLIILRVVGDPSAYVRSELLAWASEWIAWPGFLEGKLGWFWQADQDAAADLKAAFDGSPGIPAITDAELAALEEGEKEYATAALIALSRAQGAAAMASALYSSYQAHVAAAKLLQPSQPEYSREMEGARADYLAGWRALYLAMVRLHNTARTNMAQGKPPMPVPGPGQRLRKKGGPFGDEYELVDLTMGEMTRTEYLAVMNEWWERRKS